MYLTVGHFKFKEDGLKRAEQLMADMVKLGRREPGIQQYTFYASPDAEFTWFLFEEWDCKESHDRHFECEQMQAMVPEFFALLAEAPSVSYFDATLESKL